MTLDRRSESLVIELGADVYGVANLAPAAEYISMRGDPAVSHYPRAISFGIYLNHAIVDQLGRHRESAIAMIYRLHCYNLINVRLDTIASRVSIFLQREGYDAFPIPASQTLNPKNFQGIFSHKIAAHLAGLGWVGKNRLLVMDGEGPRIRLASVLTNAPLKSSPTIQQSRCGDCRMCADICPSGALDSTVVFEDDIEKFAFSAQRCDEYLSTVATDSGERVCGLCLQVCPHGRKRA